MNMPPLDLDNIRERIIEALKTVEDPEIPVNLYDLGLIYDLDIRPMEDEPESCEVRITMTLTTPNCPVAESMPLQVQSAVKDQVEEVEKASINLVWTPPWTGERMSEDAKMTLEFMGISWKDPNVGPRGGGGGAPSTGITVGRKNVDDQKQ